MDVLPRDVHVGMKVYDSRHHMIGRVDDLKFPENEDNPSVVPADIDGTDRNNRRETVLTAIAEAFGSEEMPEALKARLLREGYLRLDAAGLLAADRYILPSQVAAITGDEVTLNVEKEALLKKH
jgi:hypothetical protein